MHRTIAPVMKPLIKQLSLIIIQPYVTAFILMVKCGTCFSGWEEAMMLRLLSSRGSNNLPTLLAALIYLVPFSCFLDALIAFLLVHYSIVAFCPFCTVISPDERNKIWLIAGHFR